MNGARDRKHRLPLVAAECSRVTGRLAPRRAYTKIWAAVADGRLAAEKVEGVWHIRDENIPEVAKLLGMTADDEADAA